MTHTFLWSESEDIHNALAKRGYAHTLDSRGLTIDWDDKGLTKEALIKGIRGWVREDAAQSRYKRSTARRRV